jgi:hypothetical protein
MLADSVCKSTIRCSTPLRGLSRTGMHKKELFDGQIDIVLAHPIGDV